MKKKIKAGPIIGLALILFSYLVLPHILSSLFDQALAGGYELIAPDLEFSAEFNGTISDHSDFKLSSSTHSRRDCTLQFVSRDRKCQFSFDIALYNSQGETKVFIGDITVVDGDNTYTIEGADLQSYSVTPILDPVNKAERGQLVKITFQDFGKKVYSGSANPSVPTLKRDYTEYGTLEVVLPN